MASTADYAVLISGIYAGRILWYRLRESFSVPKSLCYSACAAIASYILWRKLQRKLSFFCARRKTDINLGFREKFQRNFVFLKDNDVNDDHDIRRLTEESIKMFIDQCGLRAYSFSSSTTSSNDLVDCHLLYSQQDLEIPYRCNDVEKDHVLYMMDVNYNFDMEQWLWKGRPILLHSFHPLRSSDILGMYYMVKDKITTFFKIGKTYNHQAFFYASDTIVVVGLLYSLVVTVDQFRSPLDLGRRLICLTPVAWYPTLFNYLSADPIHTLVKLRYDIKNIYLPLLEPKMGRIKNKTEYQNKKNNSNVMNKLSL